MKLTYLCRTYTNLPSRVLLWQNESQQNTKFIIDSIFVLTEKPTNFLGKYTHKRARADGTRIERGEGEKTYILNKQLGHGSWAEGNMGMKMENIFDNVC